VNKTIAREVIVTGSLFYRSPRGLASYKPLPPVGGHPVRDR